MIKFGNIEISEADIQAVADKMRLEKEEKMKKCSDFFQTSMFSDIVSTIITKEIFLDEEDFRYFPKDTLEQFDLPGLTKENLDVFIECMIDDDLIIPEKKFVEENNEFDNTTTEKLGLKVFMMWGQGCCIQIFPASINRRGDL